MSRGVELCKKLLNQVNTVHGEFLETWKELYEYIDTMDKNAQIKFARMDNEPNTGAIPK